MGAAEQIRKHILNLMIHHAGESVRIPSYNELAPRLGVARSSVQLVLKQLMSEGFIESKVGIGTWSVPQALLPHYNLSKTQLAGVIIGNGRFVFDHYSYWFLRSAVGDSLACRSWFQQSISLESEEPKEVLKEILCQQLDALVWILPSKEYFGILPELSQRIPMVVIGDVASGVECVCYDTEADSSNLAQSVFSKGFSRIVCSPCFCANADMTKSFKKHFLEYSGKSHSFTCLTESASFESDLQAAFESAKKPDLVIVNPEEYESTIGWLAKYYPTPEAHICCCAFMPISPLPRPVICQQNDYRTIGNKAVERLVELVRNPDEKSGGVTRIAATIFS